MEIIEFKNVKLQSKAKFTEWKWLCGLSYPKQLDSNALIFNELNLFSNEYLNQNGDLAWKEWIRCNLANSNKQLQASIWLSDNLASCCIEK